MSPAAKSRLLLAMVLAFLGGGLLLLTAFNATKPRVVVVHSLSRESAWAHAVDRGISDVLEANRLPVTVTRDYLNLDLLSEDADREALASALRRRIAGIDPDVLIAVDDETSELVGRHYAGKARPVVIYTGLLRDPAAFGYAADRSAFGVRERMPAQAIATVLAELYPGRSLELAAVGVASMTGSAEMEQLLAHAWGPHRIAAHALVEHFDDWKAFVQGPGRLADVLLVLSADTVPEGAGSRHLVEEAKVVTWTEANSAPLPIGLRHSYVHLGGGLAVSTPPVELGAMAMQLALQRLADPGFTPPGGSLAPASFDISVRSSALARRAVSLPALYQEAARGAGHRYP